MTVLSAGVHGTWATVRARSTAENIRGGLACGDSMATTTEPGVLDGVPLRHHHVQLSEVKLHCVEAGEGSRLVLLLHGFPENWFSWRYQIPVLARAGFRVVAPDQRGYNTSSKPARVRDYGLDTLARDVSELIRALGAERAAVVGHDWGTIVAWAFAMLHGEQLERLCVMNGPNPMDYQRVA